MNKTILLFRQPQMSGGTFSHRRDSSVNVTRGNESVVFQIPKFLNRRKPDPPLAVLKHGIWCPFGCSIRIVSASDAVQHGDTAVLPPVQAVGGRDPDTTVFGRNDRHAV